MDEIKRTVAELVTRYMLEPTLRDVYVEGPFDASFLAWLLGELGAPRAAVYTISTVEIPASILAKYGLTSGQKQRILGLARELVYALGDFSAVSCVVDADLDRVFGTLPTEPIVLVTDYTSLEVYLFQRPLLEQWSAVSARLPCGIFAALTEKLVALLRELFLIRCASRSPSGT